MFKINNLSFVLKFTFIFAFLVGCNDKKENSELIFRNKPIEAIITNDEPNNLKQNNSKGKKNLLNNTQLKDLISINNKNNPNQFDFKVIVPTYIPNGFKINNFFFSSESNSVTGWGIQYGISYINPTTNSCFDLFVYYSLPIGDGPTGYDTLEVNSLALGKVVIEYTDYDFEGNSNIEMKHSVQRQSKKGQETQWYTFFSPVNGEDCQAINLKESIKIIQSFQFL